MTIFAVADLFRGNFISFKEIKILNFFITFHSTIHADSPLSLSLSCWNLGQFGMHVLTIMSSAHQILLR
jgi:hypothetical protein